MVSRTSITVPAPDWLICRGAPRLIQDGLVDCPLRADPAGLAMCVACRHVEWWAEDRGAGPTCEIETSSPPVLEIS